MFSTRRDALRSVPVALGLLAGLGQPCRTRAEQRVLPSGFFGVEKRNGRFWFIDPAGQPIFGLALNHIDSSPLRAVSNGDLWERRYGNSLKRWLSERVRPDLLDWGFNSVGWTQEVVVRDPLIHRHSPSFTYEEYQWLDLPYCHLLPFAEIHQWDVEVKLPDFFSSDFEHWCDYVARSQCARFADDPKLIGYFYTDCPCWVHTRPGNQWKGPLFDPAKLTTEAGRRELKALATRYYQVTHDAIRRYDPNHLILGDRYEAAAPLPTEVLEAARPFVDVFSFQDFRVPAQIHEDLTRFSELGLPVLLADSSGAVSRPDGSKAIDPDRYRQTLEILRQVPSCVGFHLCGAYVENDARRKGFYRPDDTPDEVAIAGVRAANREMTRWAAENAG